MESEIGHIYVEGQEMKTEEGASSPSGDSVMSHFKIYHAEESPEYIMRPEFVAIKEEGIATDEPEGDIVEEEPVHVISPEEHIVNIEPVDFLSKETNNCVIKIEKPEENTNIKSQEAFGETVYTYSHKELLSGATVVSNPSSTVDHQFSVAERDIEIKAECIDIGEASIEVHAGTSQFPGTSSIDLIKEELEEMDLEVPFLEANRYSETQDNEAKTHRKIDMAPSCDAYQRSFIPNRTIEKNHKLLLNEHFSKVSRRSESISTAMLVQPSSSVLSSDCILSTQNVVNVHRLEKSEAQQMLKERNSEQRDLEKLETSYRRRSQRSFDMETYVKGYQEQPKEKFSSGDILFLRV